jgi:hypothetical protein
MDGVFELRKRGVTAERAEHGSQRGVQIAEAIVFWGASRGIIRLRRDAMLPGNADMPNGVRKRALLRYEERNDKKNAAEPASHGSYSTWPGILRARR